MVAITPFVVEKLMAIVSDCHGVPDASRAPVQASTTSSPFFSKIHATDPGSPRLPPEEVKA